jgi:transposase InsO family protein
MLVVNITQDATVKFLHSIIYRFGVPKWVLTDNGTQFNGAKFARYCADFGIYYQASSAAHTQTNGQVERANRLILQGMKTRMFHDREAKGGTGIKSCPQYSRHSIPISTEQLEILHFTLSMVQMRYCHQRLFSNQHEWHSLMKNIRQKQESSTPIYWKRSATQY